MNNDETTYTAGVGFGRVRYSVLGGYNKIKRAIKQSNK